MGCFIHFFLDMGRSAIALFILAFFFVFIAFWTGVAGCWRRSSGNITATAILMLLTCMYSKATVNYINVYVNLQVFYFFKYRFIQCRRNGTMAWRGILWNWKTKWIWIFQGLATGMYVHMHKTIYSNTENKYFLQGFIFIFFKLRYKFLIFFVNIHANNSHQQQLKLESQYSFDWSFYVSWVSVGFSLVSAVLFAGAATCLSRERDELVASQSQYLMTGEFKRLIFLNNLFCRHWRRLQFGHTTGVMF